MLMEKLVVACDAGIHASRAVATTSMAGSLKELTSNTSRNFWSVARRWRTGAPRPTPSGFPVL
jgi:hypothetical protein